MSITCAQEPTKEHAQTQMDEKLVFPLYRVKNLSFISHKMALSTCLGDPISPPQGRAAKYSRTLFKQTIDLFLRSEQGRGTGSLDESPRYSKPLWRSKTALNCTRNHGVDSTTSQFGC